MTTDDVRIQPSKRRDTYISAGIPSRYRGCAFENFVTYNNESLERALAAAQDLVTHALDSATRGLVLSGPPGTGKTHLAVAALKGTLDNGSHAAFWNTRALLREAAKDPEMLSGVLDPNVVVIDNFGAWDPSEFVDDTIRLIVETRYDAQRLTIFTTNYEDIPDDTEPESLIWRVGFSVRSRLHEMCTFVDLDGADYRMLPPNGGTEDLIALWKTRKIPRRSWPRSMRS